MKNYNILLIDTVLESHQYVESLKGTEKDLETRLKLLQKGYAEGGDKITIQRINFSSNGKLYETMVADSGCDYQYISVLRPVYKTQIEAI